MKKNHKQVCLFFSEQGIARLRSVPGKRMVALIRQAIEEKYSRIKDQPNDPKIFPVAVGKKKRQVFLLSIEHVDMAWAIVRHHSLFSFAEAVRISLKEYFNRLENQTHG